MSDDLTIAYMCGKRDGRKERLDAEAAQIKRDAEELRLALRGTTMSNLQLRAEDNSLVVFQQRHSGRIYIGVRYDAAVLKPEHAVALRDWLNDSIAAPEVE